MRKIYFKGYPWQCVIIAANNNKHQLLSKVFINWTKRWTVHLNYLHFGNQHQNKQQEMMSGDRAMKRVHCRSTVVHIMDGLMERYVLSLPFSLLRSMMSCCSSLCFSISSWCCCSNFLFCSSSCWCFAARISCCCCLGRVQRSRTKVQGDDVYRGQKGSYLQMFL